jgi:hypothetical protein
MRFRSVIPASMLLVASAAIAAGDVPPSPQPKVPEFQKEYATPVNRAPKLPRFLSFRSIGTQVDSQVIANLLAATPSRTSDVMVSATTGEIARCESRTCQVPMNVRVEGAQGMVTLTFAVANPKGQLSEVQHAECHSGDCIVSLILERGDNTISVGVLDAFAQLTGYTTMHVNATKTVADRGKTEWF